MKSFASANSPTPGGTGDKTLTFGGGIDGIGVVGYSKVYLVFYGSQWGSRGTDANGNATFSGDPAGAAPVAQQMFKGIGTNNELWSAVLTQYCEGVANGSTGCPPDAAFIPYQSGVLAGVWYDNSVAAPAQATGHQLGQEAVNAAAHFGNTTAGSNRDAYYVILSPHGTNPDNYVDQTNGFCAWHDYNNDSALSGGPVTSPYGDVAFSNQPYNMDAGAGCGVGFLNSPGTLDGWTITLGHEWQEMMSDPNPAGGWTNHTRDLVYNGDENADECAWIPGGQDGGVANVAFASGTFAEQASWSNDTSSCAISHPIVVGDPTSTIPNQTTFVPGRFANQSETMWGVAEVGGPRAAMQTMDANAISATTFDSSIRNTLAIRYGLRFVGGDFNNDGLTDFVELPSATQSVAGSHIPLLLQQSSGAGIGQFHEVASTEDDSQFLVLAATSRVYPVVGDFNGDHRADIALLGDPDWSSIPVASSTGNGFTFTTLPAPNFEGWSNTWDNAKAFVGDFNGDSKDDIALVSRNSFTTIPVATSTGTGFTITNTSAVDFEAQAKSPGAHVVVGHFDAAHTARAGLAVIGGSFNGSTTTVQTALSDGDGGFTDVVQNIGVDWANAAGVQVVPGNYHWTGLTDIALTGVFGWSTVPDFAPNGAGQWSVTNPSAPEFAQLAAQAYVTAVSANGTLMLVGGKDWTTQPKIQGNGDGTWDNNGVDAVGADTAAFDRNAQYDPHYLGPIPTSVAINFSSTASSVSLTWEGGLTGQPSEPLFFDVYKRNNSARAGDPASGWTLLRSYPNDPFDFSPYTFIDSNSNPGGDCYTVAARNNLGTDWNDAASRAVCTVRADPTLFSQTVTPTVTQWEDLDSRNGFTKDLFNKVKNQYLIHKSQTFGIDLDWTSTLGTAYPNITVEGEARLGPELFKGEDIALKVSGGGYLHFNGFGMEFASTPSYEWRVLGGDPQQPTVSAPGQPEGAFRSLNYGVFALWNDVRKDFLVKGINATGGPGAIPDMTWASQLTNNPPPPRGIKTDLIYDCSLAQHPVEVFTQDRTAGGAFTDQGQVSYSGGSTGCGFTTGTPLTFTPTSGHQYVIHVLDYQNPGCQTHDPNDGSCIVMQDAVTGDANGLTLSSGVNLQSRLS